MDTTTCLPSLLPSYVLILKTRDGIPALATFFVVCYCTWLNEDVAANKEYSAVLIQYNNDCMAVL